MNDIKKLAVFVMIAGLTMFMAVATASAKSLKGGIPSRVNITLLAPGHVFWG